MINNKLFKSVVIILIFSILFVQSSAFAVSRYTGNIGPAVSALSLLKERKVTIQVDQGSYGIDIATVQSKVNSILVAKLKAEKIEVDARVRSITTIDTVINSTAFSDDSENFYVSLNNGSYPEFLDATKSANILNLFIEKQVAFVGLGNSSNKASINTFISKNQGNGTYNDNSNLDAALSRLADYILGRTSISLDLYVGEGKYQDKAYLQTKINEILKPKLIPANIDADINIKMFKNVQKNPRFSNLYYIDPYNNIGIHEYSLTSNIDTQVCSDTSIPWSNFRQNLKVGYDGNLYFTLIDTNTTFNETLYYFNLDTRQLRVCATNVTDFTVSNTGKIYWTKSISSPKWHSEIYEYDPLTNINTFITNTKVGSSWIWGSGARVEQIVVSNDNKLFMAVNDITSNVNPTNLFGYDLVSHSFLTNGNDPATTMNAETLTNCVYPKTKLIVSADNKLFLSKQSPGYSAISGVVGYDIISTGIGNSITVSYTKTELKGGANNSVFIYDTNSAAPKASVYDIINGTVTFKNTKAYIADVVITSDGSYYFVNSNYVVKADDTHINFPVGYQMFAKYPPVDVPLITYASMDTTLQNKVFDTAKDSFVTYLGDTPITDLNDSTKKTSIVNNLKSGSAKFIGLGISTNQAQLQNLISLNNNQGAYYDNTNIDTALNSLADYIIANTHLPDRSFQNYIVVSEDSTNIESQEGTLDTNGLPSYSTTYMRSKDYIDVTGGSNYTFTTTEIVNNFSLYWYTSTLQYIKKDTYTEPPSNLITPSNAAYVKVAYSSNSSNIAITLINNTESSGENIAYSSTSSDYEKDSLEYVYKYDHDPLKINGINIDNPTDKITLNNQTLSIPIKKFTKPGTYQISMYAKDIPKKVPDTNNLIINGGAETINADTSISNWYTWAATPSITTFTRRITADWKISGTGSFEIITQSMSDGSNNAVYYQDIDVYANTDYKLSGLIGSHRCIGYFVVYEMDDQYNILNSFGTTSVNNNATPQNITSEFKTQSNTTKLRVHIVKGNSLGTVTGFGDNLFADDISLVRMIPNPDFNTYRKTSSTVNATLFAHRLPLAEFTYQIENPGGTFKIKNLADNGLSYDPDHSSRADKGIIDRQWKWAEVLLDGTTTWHDGIVPDTQAFAPGSQILLWYRVRDIDGPGGKGAWSKPKMQRVDGQLVNPVALFVAIPNPLPMQNEIELADQSYSKNLGGSITSRVWTIKKEGSTTTQTLTFDRTDATNKKYYKRFTSLGFGKYTINLTVTDSFGKASNPYSQTINVIDTIDPTVLVSPTSGTFSVVPTITGTCTDSISSTAYNRGLKTISYVWSKNATQPLSTDILQTITIPGEGIYTKSFTTSQIQEGTWYLYVIDQDYAGNTNSNGAYVKYGPYTVILNQPPTVNITAINPTYIYEGDTVKVKYKPSDNDNQSLVSNMSLTKNGTIIWTKTKTISPLGGGGYAFEEEQVLNAAEAGASYKFTVTVTDPYNETASDTTTFTSHELGITGFVTHTSLWEQHRQDYNKNKSGNINSPRAASDFFPGEKFILSANTTNINPSSTVTADSVTCKIVGTTFNSNLSPTATPYAWKGSIWDEAMLKWTTQPVQFIFTVTYSNGTVKTDDVTINILDDEYWRLHRIF